MEKEKKNKKSTTEGKGKEVKKGYTFVCVCVCKGGLIKKREHTGKRKEKLRKTIEGRH